MPQAWLFCMVLLQRSVFLALKVFIACLQCLWDRSQRLGEQGYEASANKGNFCQLNWPNKDHFWALFWQMVEIPTLMIFIRPTWTHCLLQQKYKWMSCDWIQFQHQTRTTSKIGWVGVWWLVGYQSGGRKDWAARQGFESQWRLLSILTKKKHGAQLGCISPP